MEKLNPSPLHEDQLKHNDDRWLDINELCTYHPDRPVKSTVYSWVQRKEIPFYKGKKKLRFLKSEIDRAIKEGRRAASPGDVAEIDSLLSKLRIGKRKKLKRE